MSSKELAKLLACFAAARMDTACASADIAPNAQSGANTYSVKPACDAGLVLTIRCHRESVPEDVKLTRPVAQCHHSGDDAPPALACSGGDADLLLSSMGDRDEPPASAPGTADSE